MTTTTHQKYYVPHDSAWPIVGALALLLIGYGAATWISQLDQPDARTGPWVLAAGVALLVVMLFGWFGKVIDESQRGLYSAQLDRSFRQCMSWFIFSEVMFFLAFFGALFYARVVSVPWLDGAGNNAMTAEILWPDFEAAWPLLKTPGGTETQAMPWSGLPLWNTLILLASSVTLQIAHVAIEQGKRQQLKLFLAITVLLGVMLLGGILVPMLSSYHPNELVARPFGPPSATHLFGTDQLGRDVFTRVFAAVYRDLGVAFAGVVVPLVIGTTVGVVLSTLRNPLVLALAITLIEAINAQAAPAA